MSVEPGSSGARCLHSPASRLSLSLAMSASIDLRRMLARPSTQLKPMECGETRHRSTLGMTVAQSARGSAGSSGRAQNAFSEGQVIADCEWRLERKRALSKPIWPWIALAVAVAPTTARAQTALNSTTAAASPSAGVILTNTTNPPRARVIEWNLPAQGDASPGAVVVDTQGHDANRMWFVTRVGLNNPHLYRMEFPKSLMKGSAKWTSWKLNAILAGGIRRVRA